MSDHTRIGHGWDLHQLAPVSPPGEGRPLRLGGIDIDHHSGPVSYSDGDALLHAITDALLGAVGFDDLGTRYPNSDPTWKDANSADLLRDAWADVRAQGWRVGNLDATVICESPKISPLRDAIRTNVAALLDCETAQVNVKGKTHEGLDAIGEGRAIEVHAVAVLVR